MSRSKASRGQAEPLWVEKFDSALLASKLFLHACQLKHQKTLHKTVEINPPMANIYEGDTSSEREEQDKDITQELRAHSLLLNIHENAITSGDEDAVITDVRKNQIKSRQNRSKKYNKKWIIGEWAKDDIVTLRIPRELQTSTDNLRIFCKVVSRPHRNVYELQCPYEILDRKFATKNLERVPDFIAQGIAIGSNTTKIALAEAARRSSSSDRVRVSCQCKGNCATNRCRCYKESFLCTVHCPTNGHVCQNLSSLSKRTEGALKLRESRSKRQRANTIRDVIVVGSGSVNRITS